VSQEFAALFPDEAARLASAPLSDRPVVRRVPASFAAEYGDEAARLASAPAAGPRVTPIPERLDDDTPARGRTGVTELPDSSVTVDRAVVPSNEPQVSVDLTPATQLLAKVVTETQGVREELVRTRQEQARSRPSLVANAARRQGE